MCERISIYYLFSITRTLSYKEDCKFSSLQFKNIGKGILEPVANILFASIVNLLIKSHNSSKTKTNLIIRNDIDFLAINNVSKIRNIFW